MKVTLIVKLYFYYIETIAIMILMIIMTESEYGEMNMTKMGMQEKSSLPTGTTTYPSKTLKMAMMTLKSIIWSIMV
jgi:hypothetical protein